MSAAMALGLQKCFLRRSQALGRATSKRGNCTIIPGDCTSQRKTVTHKLTSGSS